MKDIGGAIIMKLKKRTEKLKDIRSQLQIPGVIYGRRIDSTPVQVDYNEFMNAYHEFGTSMTFKVRLDGKNHQVYIKEIQTDPLNINNVRHFDLIKVTASDTITADIPVYLDNKEEVEKRGLVVQLINQSIETEFSPGKGVSNFTLDVKGMEDGDVLRVKDIEHSEDLRILEDPEKMVVNVTEPTYEDEPEEGVEEEEVEVEAIKQKAETEDEE